MLEQVLEMLIVVVAGLSLLKLLAVLQAHNSFHQWTKINLIRQARRTELG